MIIILNGEGQMCNRIKEFAHCIATGIETKQTVKNLTFGELDDLFEHKNISICVSSIHGKILSNVFIFISKVLRRMRIFNDNLIRGGTAIINDPDYYDWKALFKHREEILSYLAFKKEFIDSAKKKIDTFKSTEQELLVGVHIRRGDYQIWRNGQFFYSNEEYRSFMYQLAKTSMRPIVFVLCTNDYGLYEKEFESNYYRVCLSKGDKITDLLVLSECDYIMGPPSTYSWWAAFMGNRKYFSLVDKKKKITLNDFEHIGERFRENQEYVLYKDFN